VLAIQAIDTGAVVGVLGLILTPIVLITTAWAATRTALVKAEREGRRVANERLVAANAWNTEVEKHLAECRATLIEKDVLVAAVEARVEAQAEHLTKLLERTPEKLWEALERHSAEATAVWSEQHADAERRWQAIEDIVGRLGEILDRVESIGEEVRKAVSQEKRLGK
jgi:hypothetical protein